MGREVGVYWVYPRGSILVSTSTAQSGVRPAVWGIQCGRLSSDDSIDWKGNGGWHGLRHSSAVTFSEVEISAGFRFNGAKERLSFSRTRPIGWRSIARNKMHYRTEPYLHLPPPPSPNHRPAYLLLMGRAAYVRVCSRQLVERCFWRSQLRRLVGPYECILLFFFTFTACLREAFG